MTKQLPDEVLYDVRLIERHIRNGTITRKDVEKQRGAAEDQTDQAEWLSLGDLAKGESSKPVDVEETAE